MNNGILYTIDNNRQYVSKMINSANSFFYYNPNRLADTTLFVFNTGKEPIDLSGLNPNITVQLLTTPTYDYDSLRTVHKKYSSAVWYRFEIFVNPIFRELDNLLFCDADTEFGDTIDELFMERTSPEIVVVKQRCNTLHTRGGKPKYEGVICDLYLSGGFLLIQPKLLQDVGESIHSDIIDLAKKHSFEYNDLDAMSAVLYYPKYRSLVKLVDSTYNCSLYSSKGLTSEQWRRITKYKMKHFANNIPYDKHFIEESL